MSKRQELNTYETVLDPHTPIIRLGRGKDIIIPRNNGDHDPHHNHRQILSATHSRAGTKRHEMLVHPRELLYVIRGLKPTVGEKCGGRREDGRVAVHRPGLSRDDCAGRKSVAHEIEGLVGGSVLGRKRRDDTFEEAGGCAMHAKAYRQN